jgi:hypothetical protein
MVRFTTIRWSTRGRLDHEVMKGLYVIGANVQTKRA